MKKLLLICVACILFSSAYAQDSTVNALLKRISTMGKEYQVLKKERDPKKIAAIAHRISAMDQNIQQTDILGVDSILRNIHRFSTNLGYYSDFLNNPITLPDSLKPLAVFKDLEESGRFLASFDTVGYDTEYIEERYPIEDESFASSIGDNKSVSLDRKVFTSISKNAKLNSSALIAFRCCRIRIRVRIRVVVNPKKTYDNLVNTLENAVNTVGKIIPEEWQKEGIKILATALEVEGEYIHILNDLNQRVYKLSISTFDMIRTIQEKTDREMLNVANNLANTVGLELPPEIESTLDKLITAKSDVFRETLQGFSKGLDLNYKINEFTADNLKLFAKYLSLSAEFPKMVRQPKTTLAPADAYAQINDAVFQKAIKRLFASTVDLDTARRKGFKATFNSKEHTVKFDDGSGTILVEMGDINVKGIYLLGGMADLVAPSATINIKKIKLQMIPGISKDQPNQITFHPRLYELDVKNAMPLFDRMIAWVIEKNFLESLELPIPLDSILENDFVMKAALPASLQLKFGSVQDYSLQSNQFILALHKVPGEGNKLPPVTAATNGFRLTVSKNMVLALLKDALSASDGIRLSLKNDKDSTRFDPSYNFLHFKNINEFGIEDGRMFIDLVTQVHLRRFLGKKPKLNFEVSHATFYLTPKLRQNSKGETVADLMLLPAIDKLEIKGLNKRLTRKALSLFKKLKEPFKISTVNFKGMMDPKFEDPFRKGEDLLDPFQNLSLKLKDDQVVIDVN